MNKYLFILFLLGWGVGVQAQTLSAYEAAAQEAYAAEAYSNALAYYQKTLEIEPDKIENLYQIAEVARLFHAYEMAEKYYLRVAAHEEWSKYPHADFLLASVKKSLGKYAEAADLFQRFVENANPDDVSSEFIRDAKREAKSCRLAPAIVRDTLDYIETTNLAELNTFNSEIAPLEQNGQIYYSSLRFRDSLDAYEADQADLSIYQGRDTATTHRLSFTDPQTPTANAAFSADGKNMYYTVCTYENVSSYRCEIYQRRMLADDQWGAATRLPDLINQPGYHTTQPSLGIDAVSGTEWLFFSSDRPGGKGGMDIWCSVLSSDGSYNSLINIDEVNTYMDEISPFFHTQRQQLYFSSDGYVENIGGFDIFKTQLNAGRWSTPENAGVPLNSSYHDTYFTLDETGTVGYFSSNRKGATHRPDRPEYETCCSDIYRANIDLVVDLVVSTFNRASQLELLNVDVQVINTATGAVVPLTKDPIGNRSFFGLEAEQEYLITGNLAQYTADSVRFDTRGFTSGTTLEKELFLAPPIDLTALVFDRVTEQPLTGVNLEIFKLPSATVFANDANSESHLFTYGIAFDQQYRVVASKANYESAEVVVSTLDLEKIPTQITKELYLRPNTIDLPVVLYFDNDHPNPRTLRTSTNLDYEQTFDAYYAKRQEFIREYARTAGSLNDVAARAEMEAFFEERVLEGFNKLEIVSESLLDYLQNGNSIEIVLRGFASPRSNSRYNENLTQRRIVCVKNHFRNYRNGVFQDFLGNGQLLLTADPAGEARAPAGIASEFDDPESIYSIRASAERRVEIREVRRSGLSYDSPVQPPNEAEK